MTAERMAELVARWVRAYTRDLPAPVAQRRIEEIRADLQDHIAHERAHGTPDRRIARSIASRMVRGMAADAAWRSRMRAGHSTREEAMKMRNPAVRVGLVTALILLVPLVGTLVSDGVQWSLFDFAFAAVLLAGTGLLLELAVRRPANIAYRAFAIAIGVAAIAFGEADDAPGLVGFGCLLVLAAVALTVRTAQRSG